MIVRYTIVEVIGCVKREIKMVRIGRFIGGLSLFIIAACQPPRALPTEVSLEQFSTELAATSQAALPSQTPTRSVPTLPPTFTPTTEPSLTPTETLDLTTSEQPNTIAQGSIYYIYNGDAIASIQPDGQNNTLVYTFGVGQLIQDLSASPDGQLLSFVGPGAGSAREVYVMNRDGTYLQQVSCLGYADVRQPTWTRDGRSLAFFAAAVAGGPRDIYIADFVGSNACPTGNNQRLLVPVSGPEARDLTWNEEGTRLFYSNGPIFVADIAVGGPPTPITLPSGYGADYAPAHSPSEPNLYFLRSIDTVGTGRQGGALVSIFNTNNLPKQPISPLGTPLYAQRLLWSADGQFLLIMTDMNIQLINSANGSTRILVDNLALPPLATFSPNNAVIAYTALGAEGNVPQIWIFERLDQLNRQLTNHPDGTIEAIVWLP